MADDLSKLSPRALKAAMTTGTETWGAYASIDKHARYLEPAQSRSRRRCTCGCKRRGTHVGFCNGMAMAGPFCELQGQRWVRDPRSLHAKRSLKADAAPVTDGGEGE